MAITIIDLADRIAEAHGLTKVQAKAIVEGTLNGIVSAAAKGEEVSLAAFGKFKVKDAPEREGRNPATGATMTIAASRKVSFQPAKAFKDVLNA